MISEELEERMADVERVLALYGKRFEKLEQQNAPAPFNPRQDSQEKAIPAPDFTSQFEDIKKLIRRHDLSMQALQIYAQISSFRETITRLPKVLPVRHHHHFEVKSKGVIIGGFMLLLTTAVSVGLCFSLYRENGRLQESSIKYEMIRQVYPEAVIWADSTYQRNTKEVEHRMELLETAPTAGAK